jgi:hypothetical protein
MPRLQDQTGVPSWLNPFLIHVVLGLGSDSPSLLGLGPG